MFGKGSAFPSLFRGLSKFLTLYRLDLTGHNIHQYLLNLKSSYFN